MTMRRCPYFLPAVTAGRAPSDAGGVISSRTAGTHSGIVIRAPTANRGMHCICQLHRAARGPLVTKGLLRGASVFAATKSHGSGLHRCDRCNFQYFLGLLGLFRFIHCRNPVFRKSKVLLRKSPCVHNCTLAGYHQLLAATIAFL